jgi:AraC-like DNA-binding protein/quercetin dioxygenase-like cupin family protein
MKGSDVAMLEWNKINNMNPYVRMMRLKKAVDLTGKWRDIDNVFTYIAAGSADFIVEGIRYSLHAGNAIIIPPYMTHLIVSNGNEPLVQYIIHFDFFETSESGKMIHKDVLEEVEKRIEIPQHEQVLEKNVMIAEIPESERNNLMRNYLYMNREFTEHKMGRDIMLKAECINILVSTLRCCSIAENCQVNRDARKTKSWVHIENAIEYITSGSGNYDNDSIAEHIGVTPNYLTKVFQEYVGMPLHKYIINIKLERSQHLLLSGKVNITEAAERSGFSSVYVFSKTFQNRMGISPSEFMNQNVSREQLEVSKIDFESNIGE